MDVPAPSAGTVKEVKIKVGDMVAQGTVVLTPGEAFDEKAAPTSKPAPVAKAAAAVAGPTRAARRSNRPSGAPPVPGQTEGTECPAPGGVDARSGGIYCRFSGRTPFARNPLGAPLRARTGRGHRRGERQWSKGPHSSTRRAGLCEGGALRRAPGCRRRCARSVAVAEGGLRQVWLVRDQAAVAHPETFRCQSRAQLGDDAACHAVRRGGHNCAGAIPGRDQPGGPSRTASR